MKDGKKWAQLAGCGFGGSAVSAQKVGRRVAGGRMDFNNKDRIRTESYPRYYGVSETVVRVPVITPIV
jgi:hypothetical protein